MSFDFFINNCHEPEHTETVFGLCDDQDGQVAYSNISDPASWIATVRNDKAIALVFTPIDKCIFQDQEYPNRGRCDGMITSSEHLYFVELKDQRRAWIEDAINQLESTIEFFQEKHTEKIFKHKKAFACNKRHKHFHEFDKERNLAFFRKYGFRIDVQSEIIIV